DQRSCCHTATMLSGSVGLTSTQGSTSLLRKFTPGCPEVSQPAKGLETDTTLSGPRVNDPAVDGATVASVNAAARASSRIPVRKRIGASLTRGPVALPRAASLSATWKNDDFTRSVTGDR